MQWMHKLKLPNVSRSEVKGSIKITNPINKSLLIVYCSFNFGKENTQGGEGRQTKAVNLRSSS